MTINLQSAGNKVASALLLTCSLILFGTLLYNHFQLITFEVPLDYNEAGMLSITTTITEGKNPYTFENQPEHAVVYPVLYNSIVAPLSMIFGNSLALHRAIAGLFIFLSCGFCYMVVRRQGNSQLESFAAAILWYAALLYYSTPIASPNSLGVLLFIASISIPWLYQFSSRSLGIAMILGILAFYGKQYLIACIGFIALYLFVCVSKKRALLFGTASIVLFMITLGLVTLTSPYFLDNTVFTVSHVASLVSTYETAFSQLLAYARIYFPLIVILILQMARTLVGKQAVWVHEAGSANTRGKLGLINLVDLNAPLINARISYFWFCLGCSLLVIILVIGKNPANHLTYLFQILSPFLLVVCFGSIARSGGFKPLYYLLVVAAFVSSYSMLSHDYSTNRKNWDKMRQIMTGADKMYASTLLLSDVIGAGKEVFDNGHTRYFHHAENKPAIFAHRKPGEDITQMWDQYVTRVHTMIEAQEFDLVLLDQWMLLPKPSPHSRLSIDAQASLRKHYYLSDRIVLQLAKRPGGGGYEIRVWKPKPHAKTATPNVPE